MEYRNLLFSFCCLFSSFLTFAQKDNYTPLKWGMVYAGDTMQVDYTEIKVGEWLDFIYYNNPTLFPSYLSEEQLTDKEIDILINNNIDSALLPDFKIVGDLPSSYVFKKCKKCSLYKYSSVASNAYLPFESDCLKNKKGRKRLKYILSCPITGVSYEQAVEFCKWRTKVDSIRAFMPPIIISYFFFMPVLKGGGGEYFSFRLPTPAEFDAMNPQKDSIINNKGESAGYNYRDAVYNHKKSKQPSSSLCGKGLLRCGSFPPSSKEIYYGTVDIQGNAAEMTSVKGIAKGGSYYHFARESYSKTDIKYTKPEKWLGFRCVGILIK